MNSDHPDAANRLESLSAPDDNRRNMKSTATYAAFVILCSTAETYASSEYALCFLQEPNRIN
jgi:hypothetical protein